MVGKLLIDGKELSKLLNYDSSNEPLWASDAGRNNMSGTFTGTFNGWYPNLTLEFGPMYQDDMLYNASLLEKPNIKVTYEDKTTKTMITKNFYGTAIKSKLSNYGGKYSGFTIDLVAKEKL